jgi:hypothetical protein
MVNLPEAQGVRLWIEGGMGPAGTRPRRKYIGRWIFRRGGFCAFVFLAVGGGTLLIRVIRIARLAAGKMFLLRYSVTSPGL